MRRAIEFVVRRPWWVLLATAVVTSVNQTTREVTVKTDDGRDLGFIAGPDVKNLAQVKPGDVLTATYSEALVYEVKKGGTTVAPTMAVAGGSAPAHHLSARSAPSRRPTRRVR